MADTVTISFETARMIDQAFLPMNPNKLRKPHVAKSDLDALKAACREFKEAVERGRK